MTSFIQDFCQADGRGGGGGGGGGVPALFKKQWILFCGNFDLTSKIFPNKITW